MATTKKYSSSSKKGKKNLPPVIVVTHTFIDAGENPFPEKLKQAQEILSKTTFLDR